MQENTTSFSRALWIPKSRKKAGCAVPWEGILLGKQLPSGSGGSKRYDHVCDFLTSRKMLEGSPARERKV